MTMMNNYKGRIPTPPKFKNGGSKWDKTKPKGTRNVLPSLKLIN